MDITRFLLFCGFFLAHWAPATIATGSYEETPDVLSTFGYDLCGLENVQVLWLQDVTSDMASQLPTLHNVLKGLQNDLTRVSSSSGLAISLFTDQQRIVGENDEVCYRRYSNFGDSNFSNNVDGLLSDYLKDMGTGHEEMKCGFAGKEKNSQLLSLLYGVLDSSIGWSTSGSNDVKVIILMTGGPYHEQGDQIYEARHIPQVWKAKLYGARKNYNCEYYDYPTFDVLADGFKDRHAIVIFVVGDKFKCNHASTLQEYERLSEAMTTRGVRNAIIDVGEGRPLELASLLNNVKQAISNIACGTAYEGIKYRSKIEGANSKCDGSVPKPAAPSQNGDEELKSASPITDAETIMPEEHTTDEEQDLSVAPETKTDTLLPLLSSQKGHEELESFSSSTKDADAKNPNKEYSVFRKQEEQTLASPSTTEDKRVTREMEFPKKKPEPAAPSHNGDEESENSPPLADDADGKEEKKKSNVAAIAAAGGGVGALALGAAGYASYAAKGVTDMKRQQADGFENEVSRVAVEQTKTFEDDEDADDYAYYDDSVFA